MRLLRHTPLLLALIGLPALAAEPDRGAELHQQNCVACHTNMAGGDGSGLYTRPNRRVSSWEGLQKQVRRCELNLELRWFDDDVLAVSDYLNRTYYHLPTTP